jgi:hypothetical protein
MNQLANAWATLAPFLIAYAENRTVRDYSDPVARPLDGVTFPSRVGVPLSYRLAPRSRHAVALDTPAFFESLSCAHTPGNHMKGLQKS